MGEIKNPAEIMAAFEQATSSYLVDLDKAGDRIIKSGLEKLAEKLLAARLLLEEYRSRGALTEDQIATLEKSLGILENRVHSKLIELS